MSIKYKKHTVEVDERVYQYLRYCMDEYYKEGFDSVNFAILFMMSEGFPSVEEFWDYLEEKGELEKVYPQFGMK